MSKISITSDVMMKGLKIYSMNGEFYADIIGAANTDIGPINVSFATTKLDFSAPGQTDLGEYSFMDGKGRMGYEFNLGDVIFKLPDDEPEENSVEQQDAVTDQDEEDTAVEGEFEV